MTTQYNITEIRIGRNVGTEPMGAERWQAFQADVVAGLEFFAETIVPDGADESWTEVHLGTGTWTDKDGVTVVEESAVISLYWTESPDLPSTGPWFLYRLQELERDASIYANRYQQDAVALVHGGRSTLVKAKAVAL